jgi:hypothetical protein
MADENAYDPWEAAAEEKRAEIETKILLADTIKHTATQMMLWREKSDLAAILVECDFRLEEYNYNDEVRIYVPPQHQIFMDAREGSFSLIREVVENVCLGNVLDQNGNYYTPKVTFIIKLIETDPGWEEIIKATVAQAGITNQGFVTELMFSKRSKDPIMYGELKFGSQTEIRIAQEFESRGVLFFPLAVGVKAETGKAYKDHREVDFLVVKDGVIGILEVAGPNHNGRQVSDIEKEDWFQTSGILCVKAYPAEICWNNPSHVVNTFLGILAQHKR